MLLVPWLGEKADQFLSSRTVTQVTSDEQAIFTMMMERVRF
jgi:hypothetical protein